MDRERQRAEKTDTLIDQGSVSAITMEDAHDPENRSADKERGHLFSDICISERVQEVSFTKECWRLPWGLLVTASRRGDAVVSFLLL